MLPLRSYLLLTFLTSLESREVFHWAGDPALGLLTSNHFILLLFGHFVLSNMAFLVWAVVKADQSDVIFWAHLALSPLGEITPGLLPREGLPFLISFQGKFVKWTIVAIYLCATMLDLFLATTVLPSLLLGWFIVIVVLLFIVLPLAILE